MIQEEVSYQGTPIVWMAAGGDYAITLASLANNAGRCGVLADLAVKALGRPYRFPARYSVELQVNMDVAPAAGATVELWWAPSHNGTTFPGGATGTDAAYTGSALGTVDESKLQMMLIGTLILTPDADTTVQRQTFIFTPPTRYGCPVVVNKGGQALEGDNDSHRITFTPLVKEAA